MPEDTRRIRLYEDVCTNRTRHAEVVQVNFDPQQVSYNNLVDVFVSES
ncbi:MAG TPA: peptide-methionine (S)-S-oxide reductase [Rhizomicrobium sp.]|nr:peptide-methionine (S)-S-oxide reductase [Rhizomicrobium sp.]